MISQEPANTEPMPCAHAWSTYYYLNPQPDKFVDEIRKRSEAGHISSQTAHAVNIGFLSRVMAANPHRISAWMAALADLPAKDMAILEAALWLSRTEPAREYFEKKTPSSVSNPAPDILAMEPDAAPVLDMLWGYFFATGEAAPVRRIVSAFKYSKYAGAVDRYKTSMKTEDDQRQALLEAIFRAAVWSVKSNCQQHERAKAICEQLVAGKEVSDNERSWLNAILARLSSDNQNSADQMTTE